MQLVEPMGDVAPDARFLGCVIDQRRAQVFQPVPPAQRKQVIAPLDITGIAQTGMPRFELQRVWVWRLDHDLRINRDAVFNDR